MFTCSNRASALPCLQVKHVAGFIGSQPCWEVQRLEEIEEQIRVVSYSLDPLLVCERPGEGGVM